MKDGNIMFFNMSTGEEKFAFYVFMSTRDMNNSIISSQSKRI